MDENEKKTEAERPSGGGTGAQFVKKIGVVGCVLFLGLFVAFLIFCFTAKPADKTGDAPPAYEQTEESHG